MKRFASVLAAGLLGGWSPLAAQPSPPPTATVDASLVVTASLDPEERRETTAAVEVIDRREIELRQSERAVDLLRTVPGVATVESGSPGKVASFFLRGAASNQTLVLWNGVELNDPAFGAYDGSTLATEGIERIEVARGPFSAVWGSSAVGGVIQLLTERRGPSALQARVEAGSHALRRAGVSARRAGERSMLGFAGHLRRGDGELANDFFDGDEEDLDVELFPGAASRVGILARRVASTIGIPFDYLGQPSPHQQQSFDSTLVALPVEWGSERWRVDANASHHDSELAISDADDPFAASRTRSQRTALRATSRIDFGGGASFAVGASGQRDEATTASAFGAGLDADRQTTRALFGELGWERGGVRGTLGLRRDDSDAFGGATSLRGGVVAALGGRARLRASYGESFRAPSLGDLYYPGFSNPGLAPERGASWELGAEGDGRRWRWTATGFWNDFDQLILYDFVSGRPENIGRARSRGVELSAGRRSTAWEMRLSGTWLEAAARPSGEPLPRRPKRSAQLLAFRTAESWSAGAVLRAVGERSDVGGVRLAGYTALDLTATLDLGGGLSGFVRVDNALDRSYEEAASYPAPGRAVRVGLSFGRTSGR